MPVAMDTGSGPYEGLPNMAASDLSLSSWGVVETRAASPGLLEGRPLHCLVGSLPLMSPRRCFPLTGNSGLPFGAVFTELPQTETSCLGSQSLLAMGLFTQAFFSLGPWGLLPWAPATGRSS